jgi:hypothetical protein
MAASGNAYACSIGPYTADSDPRKGDRLLLSLVVERGMDAPGRCVIELADPLHAPVEAGAAVTIALDTGNGSVTVFTGEAYATAVTPTGQLVRAVDALAKLASTRVEAAYEEVTSDFIAKDLIDKSGASAGTIAAGPSLGAYVVHRGPRALHHLGVLAALGGADVWTDGAGKVQLGVPKSGGADHRFKLGETILALDLRAESPAVDGIEVWGEGAAGAKGADAAHWLTTDLSGVTGKAAVNADGKAQPDKAGKHANRYADGALRAGEAASKVAKAWAEAQGARRLRGRIEVAGAPEVEPGDLVGLDGLPQDHCAAKMLSGGGVVRVRGVRHVLDRACGLRTMLEV